MKKFLSIIFLLLSISLPVNCKEKPNILFNKYPITEDTILSNSNTNIFKPNERIYYIITTPHKIKTQMLFIQILKVGKAPEDRLGYELVWGKRVKMREEQKYQYSDYVVFRETGAYAMRVYSRDNPTKLLVSSYFYVKD